MKLLVVVGQVPTAELARGFVHTAHRIEPFVAAHPAPFIAKVYRASPAELVANPAAAGRVELWFPKP